MTKSHFEKEREAVVSIEAGPYAWIQWKGTDVCADIYCECGEQTHLDDDFAYYVKCGACGRVYRMCASVILMPVTIEEVEAEGALQVVKESFL